MNLFNNELILALARAALFSSLAAVIAWSLLSWLKVSSPRVHRITWLLVIVQGWLLFPWTFEQQVTTLNGSMIEAEKPAYLTQTIETIPVEYYLEPATSPISLPVDRMPEPVEETPTISWNIWGFSVWAIGTLAVLFRYVRSYAKVILHLPLGEAPDNRNWQQEWEQTLQKAGLKRKLQRRNLELRITKDLGPLLCFIPFSFLVLVPRLLWASFSSQERRSVLEHELAHYRRGDLWKSLAVRFLALPQWFNPFVWWAVRRFDEAGEWACDDLVRGKEGENETSYVNALLRVAEFSTVPMTGTVSARGGVLSRRIRRLVHSPFMEESVMKKMIVPALLFGLAIVQLVRIEKVKAEEQPAAIEKQEAVLNDANEEVKEKKLPEGFFPSERNMQTILDPYIIEPSDILVIKAIRIVPRKGYKLHAKDQLQVEVKNSTKNGPFIIGLAENGGGQFQAKSIQINAKDAESLQLTGLTIQEAEEKMAARWSNTLDQSLSPTYKVTIKRVPEIEGKQLVAPDGHVSLGRFGKIDVNGMTPEKAEDAIQRKLSNLNLNTRLKLDVFANNSKLYYIDFVYKNKVTKTYSLPVTGKETVLDAISQIRGVPKLASNAKIKIVRSTENKLQHEQIIPAGQKTKTLPPQKDSIVLPVDLDRIVKGGDESTNYQIFPGDRITIELDEEMPVQKPQHASDSIKQIPKYAPEADLRASKKIKPLQSTVIDTYRISENDVLNIQVQDTDLRPDILIRTLDLLYVTAQKAKDGLVINNLFQVMPSGKIDLGIDQIDVEGLRMWEAQKKISSLLKKQGIDKVTVQFVLPAILKRISGEHRVGPRSTVNLGRYGSVSLYKLTAEQASNRIEEKLSESFTSPKVKVEVISKAKKFVQVSIEPGVKQGLVNQIPYSPGLTIKTALSSLPLKHSLSLPELYLFDEITIGRQSPGGHEKRIVVWDKKNSLNTNNVKHQTIRTDHQLLPGDNLRFFKKPKREIELQISVIEDTERNLDEFEALKNGSAMQVDSDSAKSILKILTKNDLADLFYSPRLKGASGQTMHLSTRVEDAGSPKKTKDTRLDISLDVVPKVRNETGFQIDVKLMITKIDGQTTELDFSSLVDKGKTIIMRAWPNRQMKEAKDNNRAPVYIVLTPKLVQKAAPKESKKDGTGSLSYHLGALPLTGSIWIKEDQKAAPKESKKNGTGAFNFFIGIER